MTLTPELQAKLEAALAATQFSNPETAVQWLIRYAVDGAASFYETEVARDLLEVAESMGECDGDLIRDRIPQ